MMKNYFLILVFCTSILSLTGCWDRTELNDLALVEGVGIDRTPDNRIEMSVQISIPKASGGSQGIGDGEEVQTFSRAGTGRTIVDAFSDLQKKLPRKVFWGHTKAFLIGETLAREGIRGEMEFFAGHPQPRPKAYVFVTNGSPKDVLALHPPLERSSVEVMRELAQSGNLMKVTIIDLFGGVTGEGRSAAVPMVSILHPEKGEKESQAVAYIKSTAVFKKDKMSGSINDKVTRGVLWLRNEIKQANVTVQPEGAQGDISAMIFRAKTEIIPRIEDGTWMVTVKVISEDDVILNASQWNLLNPKFSEKLETALEEELESRIKLTLKIIQKQKKADIIGFGEAFHRTYPKQWKKVKDDWEEIFPSVTVKVDAKVYVRRPGKSNSSSLIPKEEVEK